MTQLNTHTIIINQLLLILNIKGKILFKFFVYFMEYLYI